MVSTRSRAARDEVIACIQVESSGGEASQVNNGQIRPYKTRQQVVPAREVTPAIPVQATALERVESRICDLQHYLERLVSRNDAGSGELRAIGAVIDAANSTMRQSVQEDMADIKNLMAEARANRYQIRDEVSRIRSDLKSAHTNILIEVKSMIEDSEKRRAKDVERLLESNMKLKYEIDRLKFTESENCDHQNEVSPKKRLSRPASSAVASHKKQKAIDTGGRPPIISVNHGKNGMCLARKSGKTVASFCTIPLSSTSKSAIVEDKTSGQLESEDGIFASPLKSDRGKRNVSWNVAWGRKNVNALSAVVQE
uniref:Uncharacterized protein n=2 Tax=Spongospora subterranea TaxID=70186 RepID=A0A0H5RFZ4_9EUKA|eukprot:CRZ12477.1 hypothetical protein [Spongospora subterranea]